MAESEPSRTGSMLRVLAWLLIVWESVNGAAAVMSAFNAIAVRGLPVLVVLLARLASTGLCVAAGRALLDRHDSAVTLAKIALLSSAVVQVVAFVTPYFPSNRLPGETTQYVAATCVYYGGWLAYLIRSRQARAWLA